MTQRQADNYIEQIVIRHICNATHTRKEVNCLTIYAKTVSIHGFKKLAELVNENGNTYRVYAVNDFLAIEIF